MKIYRSNIASEAKLENFFNVYICIVESLKSCVFTARVAGEMRDFMNETTIAYSLYGEASSTRVYSSVPLRKEVSALNCCPFLL